MKTLEQYFIESMENNVIDHTLRVSRNSEGKVVFYIHPANVSGDTRDFAVVGNELSHNVDIKYYTE